jgi:hypothetical protein
VTTDSNIKTDEKNRTIPKVFTKMNCKNFFEYSFAAESE